MKSPKVLAYAIRRFRRSPRFFALIVSLTALGIGAAITIFSLFDALLLRPLPVREAQNLYQALQVFANSNFRPQPHFSRNFYERLADRDPAVDDVIGHSESSFALDAGSGPERAYVLTVTDNFFTALGVNAALGRLPTPSEEREAVLTHDGWSRFFARDPDVIGRSVRLNGHAFQIIGVLPKGFNGTSADISPALIVRHRFVTELAGPDNDWLEINVRLKPGVPLVEAQRHVTELWNALPEPMPGMFAGSRLELRSIKYGASYLRDQFRGALIALMVGTALLLLIVCANAGGLLLARSAALKKETAVRIALGANRRRIVGDCLVGCLVVGIVAGIAGTGLAIAGVPMLIRSMPELPLSSWDLREFTINLRPDLRVVANA